MILGLPKLNANPPWATKLNLGLQHIHKKKKKKGKMHKIVQLCIPCQTKDSWAPKYTVMSLEDFQVSCEFSGKQDWKFGYKSLRGKILTEFSGVWFTYFEEGNFLFCERVDTPKPEVSTEAISGIITASIKKIKL